MVQYGQYMVSANVCSLQPLLSSTIIEYVNLTDFVLIFLKVALGESTTKLEEEETIGPLFTVVHK